MRRVQRQTDGVVQGRAGDVHVRFAADLLLADARQMYADREHIHIGGHSRGANRLSPFQIGFRGTHGLAGRVELVRAQQGVVIGANDARDDFHLRAPAFFAGDVLGQLGGTNGVLGLAGVVEYLVRRELRLKVIEEIGTVQRPDLEVLRSELMLRQQRAEYEDGIVASRPGFRVVDLRQAAAPGF